VTTGHDSWSALAGEAVAIWERNAAFWDERMGEGNDFQKLLVEPATDRLLEPVAGMRVLELACGNGLYARHLAGLGCEVLAVDGSQAMLEHARARTKTDRIEYRQCDITDGAALHTLGPGPFDGAVSNMALMDVADIAPLFEALPALLAPGAPFVFSLTHPCFNGGDISVVAERYENETGELVTRYAMKRSRYASGGPHRGVAIAGQPVPQWYFDRTLSALFGEAFRAGWVLDGLEEPVFPPGHTPRGDGPSWDNLPDIPPVLVARVRHR
jgi:2-polyprenyl-3-methyl-5-hydroxy-6-metoxy-1,4-benzoquinol methylase